MSGSSRHCDSPGGSRHTPAELSQQPQHGSPYSVVRRSSLLKYVPAAGSVPSQHSPSSNYVNVRSFSSGAQGTANVSAIDHADQCTDSTSRDADRDDMQQQARNVKTVFIPAPPVMGRRGVMFAICPSVCGCVRAVILRPACRRLLVCSCHVLRSECLNWTFFIIKRFV